MGMTTGGSKGGAVSEPNIVPLIDVLLVLIIICMVIAPNVPTGLPTLVPQPPPQSKPEPSDPHTVVVQVMQGGKVMINQEQTDWNVLGARLFDIFKERADKVAFVGGAEEVPYAQVARAIDIMRGAGIDHVGLITLGDSTQGETRPLQPHAAPPMAKNPASNPH
ncbi:MAG: biopolymer transporter ExbD [Candidatus Acidiferrales bacterium]